MPRGGTGPWKWSVLWFVYRVGRGRLVSDIWLPRAVGGAAGPILGFRRGGDSCRVLLGHDTVISAGVTNFSSSLKMEVVLVTGTTLLSVITQVE
jgi:hypothetical protein